jgi:hypothetical protein
MVERMVEDNPTANPSFSSKSKTSCYPKLIPRINLTVSQTIFMLMKLLYAQVFHTYSSTDHAADFYLLTKRVQEAGNCLPCFMEILRDFAFRCLREGGVSVKSTGSND